MFSRFLIALFVIIAAALFNGVSSTENNQEVIPSSSEAEVVPRNETLVEEDTPETIKETEAQKEYTEVQEVSGTEASVLEGSA